MFYSFPRHHLEFVVVVLDTRNLNLDTLAFSHVLNNLTRLGGAIEDGTTRKNGPVVKHGLRESLPTSVGAEIGGETERLVDRQVGLDVEQRGTRTLLLREDVTSPSCQYTVDTAHSLFRHLDLNKVDGLQKTRVGKEGSGVEDATSSRDDLSTTTMDSISV